MSVFKSSLVCLALMITGAASSLAFAQAATPSCTVIDSPPFWINSGDTTTIQCPTACPDGSYLTCVANVEEQVQCVKGDIKLLGPTQVGDVISQNGTCPPAPTPTPTPTPDPNPTPTPNPVPAACGSHDSGTSWWITSGTQVQACETCWDQSVISCTYNTDVENQCQDGVTSPTGQTRQGTLLGKNGQCPPQPKNCGDVPYGGTTWQDAGQTPPYQCEICSDGSPHMCVAVLQQEMKCGDGGLVATGKTQNGAVLGYTNTCPNVVSGSETYKVPSGNGQADVMFVMDTTPTMFKTLLAMFVRTKGLLTNWKNFDWQIGIANSIAQRDWWDRVSSEGDLLGLNPFPSEVHRSLTVLTPALGIGSAEWILRRNTSFNGLSWPGDGFCDQQPYCADSASQPLLELREAFQKRDDAANRDFFRVGSTFIPIIISAHDERNVGAKDRRATKPADVVADFNKKMSDMAGMKAYSFVIQPGDKKCMADYSTILKMGDGGVYGDSLAQFAKLTGGESYSICEKDYAKVLANIGQGLKHTVSSITLQQVPWKNSLKITATPAVSGLSWTVQGKAVQFNKVLPPGTILSITYQYAP